MIGSVNLEDVPLTAGAAIESRAVEVPVRVQDNTAEGIGPIRAISETPENCLRPRRRQLKHRALVVSAAKLGRAVEIPIRVQDWRDVTRICPVGAVGKTVEHLLGMAVRRWNRRQ